MPVTIYDRATQPREASPGQASVDEFSIEREARRGLGQEIVVRHDNRQDRVWETANMSGDLTYVVLKKSGGVQHLTQ